MTLFSLVPGAPPEFQAMLEKFYRGEPDPLTIVLISGRE
jgi:uncharacterized protein (DUF1810 family)